MPNLAEHDAATGGYPSPGGACGSRTKRARAPPAKRLRASSGSTRRPLRPGHHGLGDGGDLRGDHGQRHDHRLENDVGQPVAVAVAGDACGQAEEVGGGEGGDDLALGRGHRASLNTCRSMPSAASPVACSSPEQRTAPQMVQAPVRGRLGRAATAVEEHIDAPSSRPPARRRRW